MFHNYSRLVLRIITEQELNEAENDVLQNTFNEVLRSASKNRVEFLFLDSMKKKYPEVYAASRVHQFYKEGERKIADRNESISRMQHELNGLSYCMFKTLYPIPTITSDIDLLFFVKRHFHEFIKKMKEAGFLYIEDDALKGSLIKTGRMKCEPHLAISWHGMRFLSQDFIKSNLTQKKVGGSTVIIPNDQATFVTSTAHIIFDCQYLSLRDYLILRKSVKNNNIVQACFSQADKFGWRPAAEYCIQILSSGKELSFPFWIPMTKAYAFFKHKIIFDLKEKGENHVSMESTALPFIFYYWKRIKSRYSKRMYRNSWLY